MAEIYFSLAECKYRDGNVADAAALLDVVRERNFDPADWTANSYAADPTSLTDDEFINELGGEFLGERHRRIDLIRWDRFGEEWWDKPEDGVDKSIFLIPAQAINANPLLQPNGAN